MPDSNTPVVVTSTNPKSAHDAHMSQLLSKMDGQNLSLKGIKGVEAAPTIETPSIEANAPTTEGDVVEGDTALEKPATLQPTTEQETRTQRIDRAQKSLEIQRRAELTQRRARAEKNRIDQEKRLIDAKAREAEARTKEIADREKRLLDIENTYREKLRLLETSPLEFARQHGVTGQEVAQFVKEGADPQARQIALLQRQMQEQLDSIRQEYKNEIKQVADTYTKNQTALAQRNFFDYVDSAQKDAPEQFEAMSIVYNEQEIWNKANELAEKSDRLQLGWDPDRLLEEIEATAKKDPRWGRIQASFQKKTATSSPNATKKTVPNTQREVEQEQAATQPRQRRELPPRNQDTGTFRRPSPLEAHKDHVNRILQNARVILR